MKRRGTTLLLYGVLGGCGVFFLFPFYWAVISSLKSPAGLTLAPPSFYPSQRRTVDFILPAAGRIVTAEDNRWLRLCVSPDLGGESAATGGYYIRLEGDQPTKLVRWWADTAVKPAAAGPATVTFTASPLAEFAGRDRPLVKLARMIRQRRGRTDEWVFTVAVPGASAGPGALVEIIHNPRSEEIRDFRARWQNYPETLKGPQATFGARSGSGFLLFMRNSFFISIMAVIGQVLSSSLVAYGFARLQFKGRDFLFVVLLATLMIPAQVTLIPLFGIYKAIGWVDSFLPLIVPHFTAGAFNVFLLRQYMLTLPKELDESAAIDGCGPLQTYGRIILPNCVPALIVVALFTFVGTWQDVMGPLIYLDSPEYRTVTLGLEYFRSPYVDNRHLVMTGAVLAMLPVAIIFIILQRHIMEGIATTGLKG